MKKAIPIILLVINVSHLKVFSQQVPNDSIEIYTINVQDIPDHLSESKYSLVYFTATWCQPCMKDVIQFKEIEKTFSKKLMVVYIWDKHINWDIIHKIYSQHQLYILDSPFNKKLTQSFNKVFNLNRKVVGPGSTFLFSPDKKIVLIPEMQNKVSDVRKFLYNL